MSRLTVWVIVIVTGILYVPFSVTIGARDFFIVIGSTGVALLMHWLANRP